MPRNPKVHFRLKQENKKQKSGLSLKKQASLNEKCLVYLEFVYNGKRLFYSFGQMVNPVDWDPKTERVKNKQSTTADGLFKLNDTLNHLQAICESAIVGVTPEPETLRNAMDAFLNKNHKGVEIEPDKPTLVKLIDRFVAGEIKNRGKEKSKNTLKTYITCQNHLLEFQDLDKKPINFESITLDFYYKFVSFLKNKPLGVNAVGKDISILKVFMGEAVDLQYTTNLQYKNKKFAVTREESESIYLTTKELLQLYSCVMPSKVMEEQRDLFIIGAMTGLRLSDYKNLKTENFEEIDGTTFIKMITKKTGAYVVIPCDQTVMEVLKKYEDRKNKVPNAVVDQYFNRLIKEACKIAGLTETGRLIKSPKLELYNCISSHTARRSFATNTYLTGFPPLEIMKMTGHTSEKNFLKYIKMTKLDSAKRLAAHQKEWNKKINLLRVA